ncbi:pro-thyrotropin-releasing hormone [Corythoichthys intestinalis]|uniref:pro-thyrotropin-releasing hormone n=1 Tax=Corythoichthys intestinalis TaxID=161448 RepID=UPI0025A59DA7|nr:pro-thyrotropin-releasing hormone [Corythoichthys intestinalis]XP_057685922.1 pro-thyrotropin-releasing hormone [Corythoichthys intestinalis]
MKSTCLLFLACVLLCNLMMACRAQSISAEEELEPNTVDDLLLQRAQNLLLLRSILTNMPDQDGRPPSTGAWMIKRQHPGKRSSEDVDDDGDEDYLEVERRQHPGKRSTAEHVWEPPVARLAEASKRQHPGKRYSEVPRSRRQHPGKRRLDDDDMDEDDEDLPLLDKRQHPGKRFWGASQLAATGPCEDVSDPVMCAKTNLLVDFFDAKHGDKKRQHPGRRFASDLRGE